MRHLNINRKKLRSRAKIPQRSWIHRGWESAWILSRKLSNHLIPRCNRDACAPLYFSLLSSRPSSLFSGGTLQQSSQTSFRFRLSVSARFVSYTLRSPHPRKTQEAQETSMMMKMIVVCREYGKFCRVETRSISSFRAFRKLCELPSFFENESRRRRRMSSFSNG